METWTRNLIAIQIATVRHCTYQTLTRLNESFDFQKLDTYSKLKSKRKRFTVISLSVTTLKISNNQKKFSLTLHIFPLWAISAYIWPLCK